MTTNKEDKTIQERIALLKTLNSDLDEFDQTLDLLVSNPSGLGYDKINQEISPKERSGLNWNLGFSTYTLYYLYLKLQNKDPREHEIKNEMKRLQDVYKKMQQTEEEIALNANKQIQLNNSLPEVNKGALSRIIKSTVNSNSNLDQKNPNTRKLKGSVPLPETPHLSWDKNISNINNK